MTISHGQPLKANPTPQDYVERNGGGAVIVAPGRLALDGHWISCGHWATVLDRNIDDYAKSYPQIVIPNMPYLAKGPTAVKLWIYSHECGHLFGRHGESEADCFAVRRGRADGWLDAKGLQQVCVFIDAARRDAARVSSSERCALMRACYQSAVPKSETRPAPSPLPKAAQ